MKILRLVALATLLSIAHKPVNAQWEVVAGWLVGDALKDLGKQINNAVDRAAGNGNYLLENTANKASLLLANAYTMLDDQLDKRVRQLSAENKALIGALMEIKSSFDNAAATVVALEDFIVLDIQNIINQLPFKTDEYLIRRVAGYSQPYRQNGFYTIKIIGNAYEPNNSYDILIDGKKVNLLNVQVSQAHTLQFNIPSQTINQKFRETTIARLPITVVSKKISRRGKESVLFTWQDSLMLMPKYPVRYKLMETVKQKKWSDETYWSTEGHQMLAATGENYKHLSGSVSATIPDGCYMVKEQIARNVTPGTHMSWGAPSFSNTDPNSGSDRTVTYPIDHYIHDQPSHFYLKVLYRKPVYTNVEQAAYIGQDGKAFPDSLSYGTYIVNCSEAFQTYTLRATLFNGQEFTFTPGSQNNNYIAVRQETGNNLNRLIIDIRHIEY